MLNVIGPASVTGSDGVLLSGNNTCQSQYARHHNPMCTTTHIANLKAAITKASVEHSLQTSLQQYL